jgi:hypothetical protein
MKHRKPSTEILVALIPFLAAAWALAQHIPSQSTPSQLYSTARHFIVTGCSDMRTFVCERLFLEDRIRREVCLLDFISPTNRAERMQPREHLVGKGKTLQEVLRGEKLEFEFGARQIRVFKENIIQQDFVMDKRASEALRQIVVEPGDIIIFAPVR